MRNKKVATDVIYVSFLPTLKVCTMKSCMRQFPKRIFYTYALVE